MMNGLVVQRGELFVARLSPKSSFYDERGNLWSRELQAARVFLRDDMARWEAQRVGGTVRTLKDGRLEE